MMATVPHVTAWAGRTKYHTDAFLFDWVNRDQWVQLICKLFDTSGPQTVSQVETHLQNWNLHTRTQYIRPNER